MASPSTNQPGNHESPIQPPAPPPTSPVNAGSAKKEKGRVRWGADTVSSPPILTLDGADFDDEDEAKIDSPPRVLRPSVLRNNSYNSVTSLQSNDEEDPDCEKVIQARYAQERANYVAQTLLSPSYSTSTPGSRRASFDSMADSDYGRPGPLQDTLSIPLHDLSRHPTQRLPEDTKADQLDRHISAENQRFHDEASALVRSHTLKAQQAKRDEPPRYQPGTATPPDPNDPENEKWLPQPDKYRGGVLSNLLRLYQQAPVPEGDVGSPGPGSRAPSGFATPGSSGTATPTKKKFQRNRSADTITTLVGASAQLAASPAAQSSISLATTLAGSEKGSEKGEKSSANKKHKRSGSSRFFTGQKLRAEQETYITIHIAETLSRQKYILRLCKALMVFGAPTHRLEEYLRMTARVLEIDGQFLYLPGCMLISFDDRSTHTADVKIVRTTQGIELGRLEEIHEIYKDVVHDLVGVDEAAEKLNHLIEQKPKYPLWVRILAYGAASAFVAPFAFGGRAIDMPICFFLGTLVGFLQLYVAPRSELYNNVFEVTAAILTSFIARAFGTINNGSTFCFPAMAQSSIALILPGYFVLCSALELQSKAIVPGSIRMVYSIIYSLFLGFGITVGTVLFGAFVPHASSQTQCENPMNPYVAFATVPAFTVCLAVVNQAKKKQMLLQVPIATAGYVVSFFWTKRFPFAPQLGNMMAAFGIGLIANLYSRLVRGVAVVALLPAIFVQVPSGLSASGSLLSGLRIANQITQPAEPVNGTTSVPINPGGTLDGMVFSVAASMIQIAVGITIGLFLSALVVYPTFGIRHKRSGLFTL